MRIIGTTDKQVSLEEEKEAEGLSKVVREFEKAKKAGELDRTPQGKLLIKLGYDEYLQQLYRYIAEDLRGHTKKDRDFLLMLIDDDIEVLAFTVMSVVITHAVENKTLSFIVNQVMDKLRGLFKLHKLKSDNPKLHTYLGMKFRRASKREKDRLIKQHMDSLIQFEESKETKSLSTRLGGQLVKLLEDSGCNLIKVIPKHYRQKTRYVVTLTYEAVQIMENIDMEEMGYLNTNKYPMVVPPKDWKDNWDGGFLRGNNFLFTTISADVEKHLKGHSLPKIYPIINKLQKTPWRVNTFVYDTIKYIFDNNMIDPTTPKLAPKLFGGLPANHLYTWQDFIKMEDYGTVVDYKLISKDDIFRFNSDREEIKIRLVAMASQRLDLVFALNVAEKMKGFSEIYYPYMLDYRGRVYSSVNFLTPQGPTHIKAMLEFGEGKYLDTNGVHWLKIHTANVYGLDKEPYEERIRWFDDNYDLINRVGTAPLECKKDWIDADSPFEFIAACNAFKEHLSGEMVYLPIQLDATCSGIQVYSGLLRDAEGAESVNVIGSKRNDIYQIVADKVTSYLKKGEYDKVIEYKDREGVEHSVTSFQVAKSLENNITRKITKRNTMTVPYSVTMRGMQMQIWDIMDDAELSGKPFWEGDKWVANKLITTLNHRAIYDTISGAKKGQDYLVALSKTLNDAATWYGPLYDFPIRQTSLAHKDVRVQTVYGKLSVQIEIPKLNRRRQSNSIAPNFIHNIDSTILLNVIENISQYIGVIHDCFLVHPNDGYELQDCYRDGFVEVMKADPLRLIQQQLDPEGVVDFPEYGDLDLGEVKKSKYIIS